MITLLEARQSSLRNIAGVCPTSPEFRALLNDSVRELMDIGDVVGTVVPIRVCVSGGCVVFPRYVGQIRQTNICNIPTPVSSMYYEFMERCSYWRNSGYDWSAGLSPFCGASVGLTQWGHIPVFQDVMGDNRLIRAYPRVQADIGKTIQWFGTDDHGQRLTTNNGDGSWSDGVKITLSLPYGSTNTFVRHTDRVIKEKTEGPVDVYAYNATTNLLEDVAHYDPSETNPEYARYKLNSCCARSIVALVKLKFIPVEVDTDFICLNNLKAIKLQMQANLFSEKGDFNSARVCEAEAIRKLNMELENEYPDSQMAVSLSPMDGSCFGAQRTW